MSEENKKEKKEEVAQSTPTPTSTTAENAPKAKPKVVAKKEEELPVDPLLEQFKEVKPDIETILVLEDSEPNRNILKSILLKLGYQVIYVENGKKGLEAIKKIEEHKLNLILAISDIMMPDMDGFQFLETVKKNAKYAKLPFLFVTAVAQKEAIAEAAKLGISGYLLKPVSMEQIKTKLKTLFPQKVFPNLREFKKSS